MIVTWYLITLAVISILTAIGVLSSHRNGQTKAVWVLFVLVFFPFGFVIYFMSDDRIMYNIQRKRHRRIYAKTEFLVKEYADTRVARGMVSNCRYLKRAGGFVPYSDTEVKYYPSAGATVDDMLESLKSAEKFVFIEYFAISDGVLLDKFLNILENKMKVGVDVRIIYDDMGSRSISLKTRKRIRLAGGQIRIFNRLLSRFSFALNYRDHRKILVVDGKVAYTGGFNLADEYVNIKRLHGYWKDAGLRLKGEAIDAVTLIFLRQWEYVTRQSVNYQSFLNLYEKEECVGTVLPFACGPEFQLPICKTVYENIISSAREKLYIMTPYFVPDESFTQCLINCALCGVDVRVVLPSVPDKKYVYVLTRDNAEKLIKYGIKIYYLKDSFVHSKIMASEECAAVGSANLDMRSFYQQFENAVIFDNKETLKSVFDDFENLFSDCDCPQLPSKNGLIKSVAVKALNLIAPLM